VQSAGYALACSVLQALQVFAASDRPTVVHASHGRLFYSNVNVRVRRGGCSSGSPLPDAVD